MAFMRRRQPARLCVLLAGVLLLQQLQCCASAGPANIAAATPTAAAAVAGGGGGDLEAKRQKPVIVILGTAGSGTRTIHQVLSAAGVWMHPYTNKEFDSKLFIKKIKHTPPFGMPGRKSGMIWETRHSPAYYEPGDLSADIHRKLAAAHALVASEFLADVPADAPVWGWKEPQAIYTLPFLLQMFPQLHILHQTRGGRDVACSNLNSTSRRMTQPYQRHYVKLISGQDFNASELFSPRFSVAAGHTWGAVNGNARRWALQHGLSLTGRYSLTRLEDFCGGSSLVPTVSRLLVNAGLSFNATSLAAAAATINFTKCQTARWQAAWSSPEPELSSAMRQLDADIGDTLELFGYEPASPPGWLSDAALRDRLLQLPAVKSATTAAAAAAAAANATAANTTAAGAGGGRPPLLVVAFVTRGQERLLHNWLVWLRDSGTDMSRVLLVMQGFDTAAATGSSTTGVAPGFSGPSVLGLPAQGLGSDGSQPGGVESVTSASMAWAAGAAAAAGSPAATTAGNDRLLQQQLHVLAELNRLQVPVLLSDILTLWRQDAAVAFTAATSSTPHPATAAAAAADGTAGADTAAAGAAETGAAGAAAAEAAGLWYDVAVGPAVFPFDVVGLLGRPAGDPGVLQQLAAATTGSGAGRGGTGLVYLNSTAAAGAVLRAMLRQQQQQQLAYPSGSDAHGPRRVWGAPQANRPLDLRGALQHTLLMANLKFDKPSKATSSSSNSSSSSSQHLQMQGLLGVQASTAPSPLRVLLISPDQLQQECSMPAGTNTTSRNNNSSSKGTGSSRVIAVDCSSHTQQQQQAGLLKDSSNQQQQEQQMSHAGPGSVSAAAAEAEHVLRSAGLWKGAAEAPVGSSS